MSLINTLDQLYFGEPNLNFLKIIRNLLIFNLFALVFSTFFFLSTLSITNDLVQIQNVQKLDYNNTFFITEDYASYYRSLIIDIPIKVYIYFGLSLFFFMYWVRFIYLLYVYYFEYKSLIKL